MNRTLIIGGAGYIGGALTDIMNNVEVADNLLFEDRYLKNIPFHYLDVRNIDHLKDIVYNYDTVIVLAGLVGDPACAVDPILTWDVNVKHVLWLADYFPGKIVYTSSCSVYGQNDELIDESAEFNPLSIYAETKVMAEVELTKKRPDSLIYRLGTLYGVGDKYCRPRLDLVVNVLTLKAVLGETLQIYGGEQWRPIIDVKDVARGIKFGIENDLQGVYNLAQENVTICHIAKAVEQKIPCKIQYNDILFEDKRNYRVKRDKIYSTGWRPKYSLALGIQDLYETFSTNRIKNVKNHIYHNGNYMEMLYGT